mgnify:CR=1 FL=1
MLTYLAAPFSDPNPMVREGRYKLINRAAAYLISQGEHVLSPVSMFYPIDEILSSDKLTSEFWTEYVLRFAASCSKFTILTIPGWETSYGVSREREHFAARGIDPVFLSVGNFT